MSVSVIYNIKHYLRDELFAETRGEAVGSSEHEHGSQFRDQSGVATNL